MRADHKDRREAGGRAGKGKPLCGGRTGSRLSGSAWEQSSRPHPGSPARGRESGEQAARGGQGGGWSGWGREEQQRVQKPEAKAEVTAIALMSWRKQWESEGRGQGPGIPGRVKGQPAPRSHSQRSCKGTRLRGRGGGRSSLHSAPGPQKGRGAGLRPEAVWDKERPRLQGNSRDSGWEPGSALSPS